MSRWFGAITQGCAPRECHSESCTTSPLRAIVSLISEIESTEIAVIGSTAIYDLITGVGRVWPREERRRQRDTADLRVVPRLHFLMSAPEPPLDSRIFVTSYTLLYYGPISEYSSARLGVVGRAVV